MSKISNTERKRRIRNKLFLENPFCHWCNIRCQGGGEAGPAGGKLPDDFATLDHIYHRFDKKRYEKHRGELRYVLSCHKCNKERGRQKIKENKEIWEKWNNVKKIGISNFIKELS